MKLSKIKRKILKLLKRQRRFIIISVALVLALLVPAFIFAFVKTKDTDNTASPTAKIENNDEEVEKETKEKEKSQNTDKDKTEDNEQDSNIKEDEADQTETTDQTESPANQEPDSKQESETQPEPEPEPDPDPRPPESPTSIVAFYADNQSDTDAEDAIHQTTVNNILNTGANPVFHAGDLMEDGTEDSLNRFNSVTSTLRSSRSFYAALGNNDRTVGDPTAPSQLFLDNFVFPNNERWYSVNYGNLHMIILDSAFASGSSTQLNRLLADLQSNASQSRITGVMFHHPTFSSTISQQLIDYGADFVVSGHYHSYQHSVSNSINYFILSGQPSLGYMVARIYSNRVSITAYSQNNAVVDTVEFEER